MVCFKSAHYFIFGRYIKALCLFCVAPNVMCCVDGKNSLIAMSIGCERKLLCDLLLLFRSFFYYYYLMLFRFFRPFINSFALSYRPGLVILFSKMNTFVGFSRKVKAPLKWRLKFNQCMRILITVMNCNWVYLFLGCRNNSNNMKTIKIN